MSQETAEWLNQNVLIGYTDKRGKAWHYRASEQGTEPNHYSGAVPIEDVRRRLFHWRAVEVPMFVKASRDLIAAGHDAEITVPNRVAIVRDDTYEVLGTPSASYAVHQYDEMLLQKVEAIVDDNLNIGSAGLLKNGAIAWIQIEAPENRVAAGGVEFRPHLLATTSHNGSIATTYKRVQTIVVCDNTRAAALRESGEEYRVRHTANSVMRLNDARTALNIIFTMGDEFEKEINLLLSTAVTDKQYERFISLIVPMKDEMAPQARTKAENDRSQYMSLWRDDHRVTPWKNTAFGAVQAINTHRQHLRLTRGSTMRVERNMMDTLTGVTETADREAYKKLLSVI